MMMTAAAAAEPKTRLPPTVCSRPDQLLATIVLDLSRLLSRAGRTTPTGIDRVEMAYAKHLIATGGPVWFAAMTPAGRLGLLPRRAAERFVAALEATWRGGERDPRQGAGGTGGGEARRLARRLRIALLSGRERPLTEHLRTARPGAVYLLVSHHHLERRRLLARVKQRSQARFVCLIHDLIPLQFPEYARPRQAENHRRRIENAAEFADAVIVSSTVTRDALHRQLELAGAVPPLLVAPFGADLSGMMNCGKPPLLPARPYFVCVSTIEARKNHLLLLNLWRQLTSALGEAAAPSLVLIGRRGWEAESAFDMLDRCPELRRTVIEHNALPDAEMVRLLRGARAALLPSFAEGFGLPLIEALSLGVPALCSDIPASRETGGGVPEFLDPLDGLGWRSAILDYAAPQSRRRDAQLARLANWRRPLWEHHFAAVDRLIAAVAERPPAGKPAGMISAS